MVAQRILNRLPEAYDMAMNEEEQTTLSEFTLL